MLIATGSNVQVRSLVNGPIENFMPSDIGTVFQSVPGGVKTWINGETNNSLTMLEAGQIYYALSTADVEVPAFVSPADESQANTAAIVVNAEAVDNDPGDLPEMALPSNSVTTFHFQIAGKSGDNTYLVGGYFFAVVAVDDTGAVIIVDVKPGFTAGMLDFDVIAAGANKVTPQVFNTTPAYVGTVKFAIEVKTVQSVYYSPP